MFVCIIPCCERSEVIILYSGTVLTDNELSVSQAQSACEQEVVNTAAVHWSSSLTILCLTLRTCLFQQWRPISLCLTLACKWIDLCV